ncbi:rab proteins geranylgeranyltransferase component A 1 [Protopterus annectens]|uniref:rab proteins geranylgeranyltransferase component A 1 n=1 Tax=Protopterus annectens TaxID=7888 RepID=UPI001CFA6DD3|nr:rab proteins geranylgeranyltransferase component A 1 [Protopterus annectens]
MADLLPTEFDVVILGTGLQESIIAAACSRIGQRVLHIDRKTYYAGDWASFTFSGLLSWIEECKQESSSGEETGWQDQLQESEEVLLLCSRNKSVQNIEVLSYVSQDSDDDLEVGALEMKQAAAICKEGEETVPVVNEGEGCDIHHGPSDGDSKPTGQLENRASDTPPYDETVPAVPEEGNLDSTSSSALESDTVKETVQGSDLPPMQEVCIQEPKKVKITYSKIVKEGRRFNIDLVSKFLFSRGSLVDLLIKSNVSRYAEFKNVTRILTYQNGQVEQVPCSRADVFASKQLSVVEKRMLMKFLTFCMDYEQHPEEYLDFKDGKFSEFLKTKKLTASLHHFIQHSIAMVSDAASTIEGLKATQHFLNCLGRYGNTPFLFPLYGLGEIPQCFCRMCAVFGGTYCLRHSVECLVVDKESKRCKAVIDGRGQRISCENVIVEEGYLPQECCKHVQYQQISRAVLITDRSVLKAETDQQISILTVPPFEPGQPTVRVIELCSSTMTCMPGTYLVHLTCVSRRSAREDLAPVVSKLFVQDLKQENVTCGEEEEEKPHVLWALYFNMRDSSSVVKRAYADLPVNVYPCSGPDSALDCDHTVSEAKSIFEQLFPGEEFCPPAPNPEDIIYDGEGGPPRDAGFGSPATAEPSEEINAEISAGDQSTKEAETECSTKASQGEDDTPESSSPKQEENDPPDSVNDEQPEDSQ